MSMLWRNDTTDAWRSSEVMEDELLKESVLEIFRKSGIKEMILSAIVIGLVIAMTFRSLEALKIGSIFILVAVIVFVYGFLKHKKFSSLTEFEWSQAKITDVRFRISTRNPLFGRNDLLTTLSKGILNTYEESTMAFSKYIPSFYVGSCSYKWLSGFEPTRISYSKEDKRECEEYKDKPVYLVRAFRTSSIYMIPLN